MTKEKIEGHDALVKVDGTFVVNEDDAAYQAALARRAREKKIQETESRLDSLEGKMDLILNLLQQKA